MPLKSNVGSVEEASDKLGRPLIVPGYLPPTAVYGPQIVVSGDVSTGARAVTSFYGRERKVVLQLTQAAPVTPNLPAGIPIVTVGDVNVALLLDVDEARFKDGTFSKHAYAQFTTADNSFVIELFASTDTATEDMTAELLAVSTSMIDSN